MSQSLISWNLTWSKVIFVFKESFDIYISYDSGVTWSASPIVDQQYNDGEYSWRPPSIISDTVRLKIKCYNDTDFGWVEDESDADF